MTLSRCLSLCWFASTGERAAVHSWNATVSLGL